MPESVAHIAEALWMQALEEGKRRATLEQRDSARGAELDKQRLELRSHVLTLREGELDSRLRDRDRTIEELNLRLRELTGLLRKEQATRELLARQIAELQSSRAQESPAKTENRERQKSFFEIGRTESVAKAQKASQLTRRPNIGSINMRHTGRVGILALWLATASVSSVCSAEPESNPREAMSPQDLNKFVGWFDFFQKRNVQKYAVPGANHIDESNYVKIGGIDQWVTIRGQDRNNPALLILHGGPGDVTNPWGYAYFHEWEKYFTVVQWDQRGAGRTLEKTGETIASTMTIDQMVQDGIEVSEYLRQHLNQDKIVLVGHSWGSLLGLLMAKARPELFYAFVGTGQVSSSSTEANIVAHKLALQWARTAKNADAVADLNRIGPPPYKDGTEGWGVLYKWRNACEGPSRDVFLASTLYYALSKPGYTLRDFNYSQDGQVVSGDKLFEQITSLDHKRLEGNFDLPIFVIQGENDCTTPAELAHKYLDSISAPRKDFVLIPGEGHFAAFIKSDEFLKDLVARVRPLAAKTHAGAS